MLSILPADREVSEYLVGHPGIDKISFTGSVGAGKRVMEVAARNLTRGDPELGGKSAAVVLPGRGRRVDRRGRPSRPPR
ncbi:aldehyde dehydrogenase family protein [Streptomyces sp. KL116D]|uniref:aldehyde dehydrogenase family protein n=1 Tax=Streptomyces sp. KL116D TaxID=3045152 RepID=UPI0035580435